MPIGNKIFPYPILNSQEEYSDYKNSSNFRFAFDGKDERKLDFNPNNNTITFKNLHFELKDNSLQKLVDNEQIKCIFTIECSSTILKESFEISTKPQDVCINAQQLRDTVVLSAYLYAASPIINFESAGFVKEFKDYKFNLEKWDILAVDENYKFKLDLKSLDEYESTSIFTIVKKKTTDKLITYQDNNDRIIINLPEEYYNNYKIFKNNSVCNNIVFGVIAIPILTICLRELKDNLDIDNFEELCQEKSWFSSILASYKTQKGHELTKDLFDDLDPYELAQIVMQGASCLAIKDISSVLLELESEPSEDDQ